MSSILRVKDYKVKFGDLHVSHTLGSVGDCVQTGTLKDTDDVNRREFLRV